MPNEYRKNTIRGKEEDKDKKNAEKSRYTTTRHIRSLRTVQDTKSEEQGICKGVAVILIGVYLMLFLLTLLAKACEDTYPY